MSGDDATSFLQSLVSQDLDPIADGSGAHSLLLQPQGKLVVEFRALRVGDEWWLDCEAAFGALLAATLTRYRIRVKVDIDDRSATSAMVSARGAGADDLVRERVGVLPSTDAYAHVGTGAGALRVVRVVWPGFDGVDVLGPASELDALEWPAFDPDGFEAARIAARRAPAGRRPRRFDHRPGGVPGAGRGLVHQGLLPRPGARVPHRHARAREPVPARSAPHDHGTRCPLPAPRSSRARRSWAR